MTVMNPRRYFDNAATSFPKPPGVEQAMVRMLSVVGGPGRGAYSEAREAGRVILDCREKIARLVSLSAPTNVVFTLNTTDALNMAIKGVLFHERTRRGPLARLHVVTTTIEHNSVLRTLHACCGRDARIDWTRLEGDPVTGLADAAQITKAIRPGETVLVCVNHASNVTGAVHDLGEIGRACAAFGAGSAEVGAVRLLVDGAQSLGHVTLDMRADHVDLLAFPGHKGLLGPTGTGGLCIAPGLERSLSTYREGGTGSVSEQEVHPEMMPEKFEAGSHNTVGIAGLGAGVSWLLEKGIDRLREHEFELMGAMLSALSDHDEMPGLRLLGSSRPGGRVGVFSVVHESISPSELSTILENEFGVLTRSGLHCAPLIHKVLGTSLVPGVIGGGGGATRLSLGPFLNLDDVRHACAALGEVCRSARGVFAK